MREPQELQDEEYEQLVGRVAAVDVAKASGMVFTRVPHPSRPARRVTKVWEVDATTIAITELADHLVRQGIEKVTVESTSDYWRPFLYLLQAAGLSVQLVNALDVKNVPGRPKTDRLDAVWLAKLTERGMLRPSFVPPGRDPPAARLHPAADRPDPRARPLLAAAGEAAGGRPDQAVHRGHRHHGQIRPGDAGGADLRPARPQSAGRPGPWADEGQARRTGAGPHRPVRRPPRRAGPPAAGPVRRPDRPDRPSHRPYPGAAGRHPRRA